MISNIKAELAYPRYQIAVYPEDNTIFEGQGIKFNITATHAESDGPADLEGQPEWIETALKEFLDAMVGGTVMGYGRLYKFAEDTSLLKTTTDQ